MMSSYVVTGGARGIGRAIAAGLAAEVTWWSWTWTPTRQLGHANIHESRL
jgi:NAD(P)-dependent dehydrogenase (short-subunit alcohol dehydrogenase family)